MKKILVIMLTILSTQLLSQELELRKLDRAAYFDFWEGTWEGTWTEGEGIGKALNKITWISGDKVLQEKFEIIEGQNKGFQGTSISVFRPQQKEWRQAWADNQGGYFDFIGRFDGGDRIFQTAEQMRAGKRVIQRMVFREIRQDSFTWDWEMSTDGGENWNLNWQIKYVRRVD